MDLIYSGPLFRSAIPVKDQKGFVRANTKKGTGFHKQTKSAGKLTEDRVEILVRQYFYQSKTPVRQPKETLVQRPIRKLQPINLKWIRL